MFTRALALSFLILAAPLVRAAQPTQPGPAQAPAAQANQPAIPAPQGAAASIDPTNVLAHVVQTGTGWGGEAFYIWLDTPLSTPCPHPGQNYVAILPSSAQYKENVAQALLALSTGNQVAVWYDSTCNFISLSVMNH
jgi:hypothetical protein